LFDDFETEGWKSIPWTGAWQEQESYPMRTNTQAHSGQYCLAAKNGVWESPRFPVTPFHYYQLDFYSMITPSGPWSGHWAAFFYDKDGMLLPDHYSSIDASHGWLQNSYCFRAKVNAASCAIRLHPEGTDTLYIDDIAVREVSRAAATRWADAYYAQIPPVSLTAAPERCAHLPRTMARLRDGGTLRIVMLGDSIINDTGTAPYDLLVERMYPKARLEVITSVRGGGSCGYYQQENRVKNWVLDYQPDLVMIGGISNDSAESVREVIRQIRAKSAVEILVMSGCVSSEKYNPRTVAGLTAIEPGANDYRSQLARGAEEAQVEFLDMTAAWAQYILATDKPYEWFQRDRIHANDRGRAVLSRILERYFAPK
jgi:lysophospholipase L1-like esterase